MQEERFHETAGVTVERSITLPADPETVWQHLTEGDLLGDWMEGRVEISPRPGGPIRMTPEDGSEVWGTVEEWVPGRRLQWTWRSDDGLPTLVEIEIDPSEEGTVLTVRETLLPWSITGLPPQWIDPPFPDVSLLLAA
jgi:uncharacterized protein YndB with AHSA1/START domain